MVKLMLDYVQKNLINMFIFINMFGNKGGLNDYSDLDDVLNLFERHDV